jgi:hypothetical protein
MFDPPRCLFLGHEISSEAYSAIERSLKTLHSIDLTRADFERITSRGLAEISRIPDVCQNLRALFLPSKDDSPTLEVKIFIKLCPSVHLVFIGKDIVMRVRDEAVEVRQQLAEQQQKMIRCSVSEGETQPTHRDATQNLFVVAAQHFLNALTNEASLSARVQALTQRVIGQTDGVGQASDESELAAWRRAHAEAQQLALFAAEAKELIENNEPHHSMAILQNLHKEHRSANPAIKPRFQISLMSDIWICLKFKY